MKWLKVIWHHAFPNEPLELYSEIDDDRWEVRKVEVFANSLYGFADKTRSTGETRLSETKLPSLEEIAIDPQFQPVEISASDFEKVWITALHLE